jgi:hypothetical protein
MRIEIEEAGNRVGKFGTYELYNVWHDGELIAKETTTPFDSAIQVLIKRDPNLADVGLEGYWRGSDRGFDFSPKP